MPGDRPGGARHPGTGGTGRRRSPAVPALVDPRTGTSVAAPYTRGRDPSPPPRARGPGAVRRPAARRPGAAQRQREPVRAGGRRRRRHRGGRRAGGARASTGTPTATSTALRADLADYLRRESGVALAPEQVWAANGSNEVMLHLLQAFGGPGRTALSFAPTYSMYPEYARDTLTGWVAGPPRGGLHARPGRSPPRPRSPSTRPRSCCWPAPTTPPAPRCRRRTIRRCSTPRRRCRAAASSSSTRPTASSAAPGRRRRSRCCADHPHLAVSRTMSKAFGAGRRPGRLPGRGAGAGRRAARGAPAVPPVRRDPGGRAGGAAARAGAHGAGRVAARRARRDRRVAARAAG